MHFHIQPPLLMLNVPKNNLTMTDCNEVNLESNLNSPSITLIPFIPIASRSSSTTGYPYAASNTLHIPPMTLSLSILPLPNQKHLLLSGRMHHISCQKFHQIKLHLTCLPARPSVDHTTLPTIVAAGPLLHTLLHDSLTKASKMPTATTLHAATTQFAPIMADQHKMKPAILLIDCYRLGHNSTAKALSTVQSNALMTFATWSGSSCHHNCGNKYNTALHVSKFNLYKYQLLGKWTTLLLHTAAQSRSYPHSAEQGLLIHISQHYKQTSKSWILCSHRSNMIASITS